MLPITPLSGVRISEISPAKIENYHATLLLKILILLAVRFLTVAYAVAQYLPSEAYFASVLLPISKNQ
jgi:hypothetical protein